MNNTLIAQGPTSGVAGLQNREKDLTTKFQKLGVIPEGFSVVGGKLLPKNRPGGFMRGVTGFMDLFNFGTGRFDLDKQGNFGHKKNIHSGAGGPAPGYEVDGGDIVMKDGYEPIDPLDPLGGAQKEGTRKEEAKQERISMEQEKYKMGSKLANENLMRAQLASIPEIMLRGGEGQAAIYSQLASDTLKWAQNLPKYQLPPTTYAPLRDYRLT